MTKKINPVVVIPIYKDLEQWNNSELVSLKRCYDILGSHTIYLIGPNDLNWELILNFIHIKFGKRVLLAKFNNVYFANISGYNKILKSLFFYEYFCMHSHLLIYQLDAYVFKDELNEWCKKGYDYIGAPWLAGLTDNSSTELIGVGNGGFSLHKIKSSIKVLKKARFIVPILEFTETTALYRKLPKLKWLTRLVLLRVISRIKNQRYILNLSINDNIYEDIFWGKFIPATFSEFKVAPIEEALKFSFEVNPRYLYNLNNQELPFGCHAWEKYDSSFWSQFIDDTITIKIV